jgi:hypothetical protein
MQPVVVRLQRLCGAHFNGVLTRNLQQSSNAQHADMHTPSVACQAHLVARQGGTCCRLPDNISLISPNPLQHWASCLSSIKSCRYPCAGQYVLGSSSNPPKEHGANVSAASNVPSSRLYMTRLPTNVRPVPLRPPLIHKLHLDVVLKRGFELTRFLFLIPVSHPGCHS